MAEYQEDPVSAMISEFSTRLNEIEEKQRLLKDRILLVGENLISTKEDYSKQEFEIKKQLKQLGSDISSLKQLMQTKKDFLFLKKRMELSKRIL